MSRFYLLRLTPPQAANTPQQPGQLLSVSITVGAKEWTSHPNGIYDPAAHEIVFDVQVVEYAATSGAMVITIEGPRIQDIFQAANYSHGNPANQLASWRLDLYGGMTGNGLPLSLPSAGQPAPGLLMVGEVLESFGNWTGTDMSLSFLVIPSGAQSQSLINLQPLVFNWQPNEPMAKALQTMFNAAFPGLPQRIQVSSNLAGPIHGMVHGTNTLRSMARFLLSQTKGPNYGMPKNYPGVSVYIQNGVIVATDGTQTTQMTTVQLSEESFIGQPTWIGNDKMSMNLVMRPDMQVGNYVLMPKGFSNLPGFVNTIAGINNYTFNYHLAFAGKFIILSVRHLGRYRSTSGEDWATIVEAQPVIA